MRQLKIVNTITDRSDEMQIYLKEINQYPILTPEEEVELAGQIRAGSQAAKEKLVCSNLRFVVSVAKQYQTQSTSLMDLINEGNVGLIKAADRFDETRGFKFISYAVWWIRQSILQSLADHSRMVRLPLNMVGALQQLSKAASAFEQENERRPTMDELAEMTGIPEDKIRDLLESSSQPRSVDAPFVDGEDGSLVDILVNQETPNTDSTLIHESLSSNIDQILSHLKPRDAFVIRSYYGIGCPALTLDEIGSALGLTRERVRQIKENSVRSLTTTSNKKLLRDYL